MISDRIISIAGEKNAGRRLDEVVIGLGFTFVRLDGGACGLSYTLRDELEQGCDAYGGAGSLAGRDLEEVLAWIGGGSVIDSAVGLAAANAVLFPPEETFAADLLASLRLQPGERLVTVGRFRPMEPEFARAGVELEVIERGDPPDPLDGCDVALITATSIINGTLEGLLGRISGAREVAVIGPSTPYAPAAFEDTPVTVIAGSAVADAERARRMISEGGGTRTLGKSLRKWVARVGTG